MTRSTVFITIARFSSKFKPLSVWRALLANRSISSAVGGTSVSIAGLCSRAFAICASKSLILSLRGVTHSLSCSSVSTPGPVCRVVAARLFLQLIDLSFYSRNVVNRADQSSNSGELMSSTIVPHTRSSAILALSPRSLHSRGRGNRKNSVGASVLEVLAPERTFPASGAPAHAPDLSCEQI